MDESQPPPPPQQPAGTQPIRVYCPHCQSEIDVQPQFAGQVISCPSCNGRFQTPLPQAAPAYPPPGLGFGAQLNPGIKICILISGIWNLLMGLLYVMTCWLTIFGGPMIVLGIFEILYFTSIDKKPAADALSQSKILGILEIIAGIFNFVSLPCGILVLIFSYNQRVEHY